MLIPGLVLPRTTVRYELSRDGYAAPLGLWLQVTRGGGRATLLHKKRLLGLLVCEL